MSNFKVFKKEMQKHIAMMLVGQDRLFVTDVSKDDLWHTYLDSFPEGTNEIHRERREFDCNCCRQFIRPFGNMVVVKNNSLISIWDMEVSDPTFAVVTEKMSALVKSAPIRNIFVTKEANMGTDYNREQLEDKSILTWEHFHYKLPAKFVNTTSKSAGDLQGTALSFKQVFQRSMVELTLEAGNTFLDLIDQKSIYRGKEHRKAISEFIKYKTLFMDVPDSEKDNWCWVTSGASSIAKIRNTAVGTLLIDLSKEMDLDEAVKKFERVMAPSNYKRPKAIFTKKMVEQAEKTMIELGLEKSLGRKHAVLEDITINNVLWTNRDAQNKMGGSIFDELKDEVAENPKKFNKVEEVSIEDFVENILPTATNVEVMMENRHKGNFMSLVAPTDKDAKSILQWNNNFSWAYNGDVADSMKQNVKSAGGDVDGVLRFSIQWNDDRDNDNDFDAHVREPRGGEHLYYGNRTSRTSGKLDVDIQRPMRERPNGPAVENITWTDKHKMLEGRYEFFVHNYSHNGGRSGFTAEIEYEGEIYSYEYPKELRSQENVPVATLEFSRENGIKFIKSLDSTTSSKEIWGVNTNKFTKVSVAMLSPNYWDGQEEIMNKHYFFFMDECKNENAPRGFYNEHLNTKLMEHKRVFEAMGSKMRVASSDRQLSGLGFSSTQRNSITTKIEGNFSRVIKINF
jgi:hypothetical protein